MVDGRRRAEGRGVMANPHIGQQVQIWYALKPRRPGGLVPAEFMPHHGKVGVVRIVGRGKPRNHGIELAGQIIAIPCGNLRPVPGGES